MGEVEQDKRKILERLRKDLKGICQGICPRRYYVPPGKRGRHKAALRKKNDVRTISPWSCADCINYFGFLNRRFNYNRIEYEGLSGFSPCPCHYNVGEEVFIRLDEVIEELKNG